MKKISIRLLALSLAICLIPALGACSGGRSEHSAVDSSAASSSALESEHVDSAPVSSAAVGGLGENDKFATMADFANSDAMQSQLDGMKAQFGGDDSALEITGEGNKLIYTFTYDLGGQDAKIISAALEEALKPMASTFGSIAASLKEAVEVDDPVLVITYKTSDGTELFSKEYSADNMYEESGSGSSYSSSNNSEQGPSVLKITADDVTSNSSYTICTGSVKNTGTKTYEFIKVKGAFKDSNGEVVDTDWAYAAGAEGLAPGEASTFRLSVTKNSNIASCSVSLLEYE